MPPNQFEPHQGMLKMISKRKNSYTPEKHKKRTVGVQSNLSKDKISNYYLKGAKDIFKQQVFSEPRLSRAHDQEQSVEMPLEDSLMVSNIFKDDSKNQLFTLPKISKIVRKSHSVSRLKWNQKINKIVKKRAKHRAKLMANISSNSVKILQRGSRPRRVTKTKLESLYRVNSPKVVSQFCK
ncbi:unnamed protein product [Moneuplotes crassus]|uniref:Uncharacterized protein n=1 Tax=Euplotes crassus TaxID=5936 RepID=A0AAD1Y797_EUPCR|nr:unnamed protein product [Moneuplotes crassus]